MTRLTAAVLTIAASATIAVAAPDAGIRVATYNVSFYRDRGGEFSRDLATGVDPQARRIAEVIRRVRPDVLLLNEVDYDATGRVAERFVDQYLKAEVDGVEPIDYPHRFTAPVNTGEPTEFDLDNDGKTGGPADCYGFGRYPGQYGMLILSRLPIDAAKARTFQRLRWVDMPGAKLPTVPPTGKPFYSPAETLALRLSSKSFWDVPVVLPSGEALHLLCSHPTPPGFDGPEDRNGKRNYDEIRLVADYLTPEREGYLVDDNAKRGGLGQRQVFVILGDLNADPADGSGIRGAIQQLLDHPRVNSTFVPSSEGGLAASVAANASNAELGNAQHRGDPSHDTADFGGDGYSNLRVDYVLPSRGSKVLGGGVFWPQPGEPGAEAIKATDHRLVWLDLEFGPPE